MPESFDQSEEFTNDMFVDDEDEFYDEDEEDLEDDPQDSLDDDIEDDVQVDGEAGNSEEWEEADDPIADCLYEIVSRMGFSNIDIEWEDRADHVRYFVEGHELGALIGRHGNTLEALQFLVGTINSKRKLVEHKIIVDVEGYRERREVRLRRLAQRTANGVTRSGKAIVLEPMQPGDRRVIHLALSRNPFVTTYSEGKDPDRYVVVIPRRERA